MWNLSSPTRDWTHSPALEGEVLTTETPGTSQKFVSFYLMSFFCSRVPSRIPHDSRSSCPLELPWAVTVGRAVLAYQDLGGLVRYVVWCPSTGICLPHALFFTLMSKFQCWYEWLISSSQKKTVRHRDIKELHQSHTASKWQKQWSNFRLTCLHAIHWLSLPSS